MARFATILPLLASFFAVARADLDSFVAQEAPLALAGVESNIGPDGATCPGCASGITVASPSGDNPNYQYTWTRDSALTFKQLVESFTSGDSTRESLIKLYVDAQAKLQNVDNPSGGLITGGLGEPKFMLDGTAFTGDWGRPQRDGPALRAITLTMFAEKLLNFSSDNSDYVKNTLWPIIFNDLNYVDTYWNQTGFDLWEEVEGSSFFTIASQYRSLVQGNALASTVTGSSNSTWSSTASSLLCFLQDFFSSSSGYYVSNINLASDNGRSGIDANTLIASIHMFDPEAGCDAATAQPCSDRALANHKVYVDAFREIYEINEGINASDAVSVGRYPEDVFYGGNPWYLAVAAAGEQLYDALYVWAADSKISVTDVSLPFFQQFLPTAASGSSYASSSDEYSTITAGVENMADGFVALLQKYVDANGTISEEYMRNGTGAPTSAYALTWSFSSFLTLQQARDEQYDGYSWGAKGASTTCVGGGAGGQGAPVNITFNVDADTVEGQKVYLAGSVYQLASWESSGAIAMVDDSYPTWTATVELPQGLNIEYKFLKMDGSGTVTWESGSNRDYTVPSSATVVNDTWQS